MVQNIIDASVTLVVVYWLATQPQAFNTVISAAGSTFTNAIKTFQGR